MRTRHVGMGVVVMHDAFKIDKHLLYDYMSWLDEEREDTFRMLESGVAVNQTGFKFSLDTVHLAPRRYMDLYGERSGRVAPERFVAFAEFLEQTAYELLVAYCSIFPDAATTAWWRPAGHIATYDPGQRIGRHCDDQIPFEWGERPENQVSMHASTSINMYLNSYGEDFSGGEISFPHAGYTHQPIAGSAALYPSNYVGRHEVNPVKSGLRITFLTMACYGISSEDKTEYVGKDMGRQRFWMPNLIEDAKQGLNSNLDGGIYF